MTRGFIIQNCGTFQKLHSINHFSCHLFGNQKLHSPARQSENDYNMAPWCERCQRSFPHSQALEQHLINAAVHNYCSRCERDFPSGRALQQHKNSSLSHWICGECRVDCYSSKDLDSHIERRHWHCSRCNLFVASDDMLEKHYVQSSAHHYCGPCKREFRNDNELGAVSNRMSFYQDHTRFNDGFCD